MLTFTEILLFDFLDNLCNVQKEKEMIKAGVDANKIIFDPGIGFGKTMRLNKELVNFSSMVPNKAVMIGYSKKRFLGEQRFDAKVNIEAGAEAIKSGAAYLRVHDVRAHFVTLK